MTSTEFERRLRALAKRDGMTFSTLATLSPADRAVVVNTILRHFEPGATYGERDVNERLKAWLARGGAMFETDHVHVRRWLIDTAILVRTSDCAAYNVHPDLTGRADIERGDDVAALDVDAIVAETRTDARERRAARKSEWLKRAGSAPKA
jgi:hypothetical protein